MLRSVDSAHLPESSEFPENRAKVPTIEMLARIGGKDQRLGEQCFFKVSKHAKFFAIQTLSSLFWIIIFYLARAARKK